MTRLAEKMTVPRTPDIAPPANLALSKPRVPALPDVIRPSPALLEIKQRVEIAVRENKRLVLIPGAYGCGKSTALMLLAQKPSYVYWEARAGYSPRDCMADILQQLNMRVGEGWRQRTDTLTRHLQDYPRTLLIDESQRMGWKTLDQLKFIADNAGITIVLSGGEQLEKTVDKYGDIASRVGKRIRIAPLTREDFARLYADDGYPPKVLDAIVDTTKGVYRRIRNVLDDIDLALADSGQTRAELTPAHVRAIADEVL